MGAKMKLTTFKLDELTPFEGNARRGNVDLIAESLQINGQYKPIVVNVGTHTGIPNEVLAGNHTLAAAQLIGLEALDAVTVDVDRQAALKIVAVDNRSNDVATYDDAELIALLQELDDLEGTGFDDDEIEKLLAALDEAPEFTPDDEDDVRLDRKSVTDCPKCGHTFTPVTRTVTEDDLANGVGL